MLLLIILVEHVMTQAVVLEKHINVTGVQLQDKHTSQMSELRLSAIP